MRGCVVPVLLLLLLATNGYALWQVSRLRAEVATLRAAVGPRHGAESETNLAEAALKAVQQGQWERARAALETLRARVSSTELLVGRPRKELQRRLAEAETAIARKRHDAAAALQAVLRELSPHKRGTEDGREEAL